MFSSSHDLGCGWFYHPFNYHVYWSNFLVWHESYRIFFISSSSSYDFSGNLPGKQKVIFHSFSCKFACVPILLIFMTFLIPRMSSVVLFAVFELRPEHFWVLSCVFSGDLTQGVSHSPALSEECVPKACYYRLFGVKARLLLT